MRRAAQLTCVVATVAACLVGSARAEVPLWHSVQGEHCEFEIRAAPEIAEHPDLVWILENRRRDAEHTVRSEDEYARNEIAEANSRGEKRVLGTGGYYETFHLLAQTGRYAAVLTLTAGSSVGASHGHSGEYVAIYRLSDRKKFEDAAALALDTQADLLRRLAIRDANAEAKWLGGSIDHDAEDDDTRTVGELLGVNEDDTTALPASVVAQYASVGFTTDGTGRVKTIDIYISRDYRGGGRFRAYRWSIAAGDAAPLLVPQLRDLIGARAAK